jgi:hypothetical protein
VPVLPIVSSLTAMSQCSSTFRFCISNDGCRRGWLASPSTITSDCARQSLSAVRLALSAATVQSAALAVFPSDGCLTGVVSGLRHVSPEIGKPGVRMKSWEVAAVAAGLTDRPTAASQCAIGLFRRRVLGDTVGTTGVAGDGVIDGANPGCELSASTTAVAATGPATRCMPASHTHHENIAWHSEYCEQQKGYVQTHCANQTHVQLTR